MSEIKKQKSYQETHPEEYKAYQRAYREAHKEELYEKYKQYLKTDAGKKYHREKVARYREAHREKINARRRELYRLKKLNQQTNE